MGIDEFDRVLFVGALVVLVAIAAVRLSTRSGLPSLLLYLGLGLVLGEDVMGLKFSDAELAGVLGYAALVIILAEGGVTTRWSSIRPSVAPAAVLATVGTVVSILVTGSVAHFLFDLDWPSSLLIGAVVSSTDAAAVFSVLRRIPLPPRLVGMLEAESGFNDAPVVIAVLALTEIASGESRHGVPYYVGEAVMELALGAAVGLAVGWLGAQGLRRVALPASGLYPIAVLGLAVFAYGLAAVTHGSGFLATYLCGLVLGNSRLPHRAATKGFAEGLGWIAQIGLFVMLGLLADPSELGSSVLPALGVGLALLLLARPLSVVASVSWFGVGWREQALLSWAGLRGAVPIVLATIPIAADIDGSDEIFELVFVLVVVFTLVQAPALPWVVRRLGLLGPVTAQDLDVEASPLGAHDADILNVTIGPTSRLHGVELFELRLPKGANVTLVVRGDEAFVPTTSTMLRHGDALIVVVPLAARAATEERIRAVSAGGKLAGWRDRGAR